MRSRPEGVHAASRPERRGPHRFAVTAACVAFVLSACAGVSDPDGAFGAGADVPGEAVRFRCGELDVRARFLDGGATVGLVVDDLDERLPRVAADDGEKYEQGVDASYRLFWTKGDTARLAIGSDAWWACERIDPIGVEEW